MEIEAVGAIAILFDGKEHDLNNFYTNSLNVDLIIRGNTRRKSADGGSGKIPIYSTGDRGKVLYQFDLKYISDSSLKINNLCPS